MKNLPILIQDNKHKRHSKYNMKKYPGNVRVALKNKEIHVPKKQKFHEVREIQEEKWKFLSVYLSPIYWSIYSLSVILIFVCLFSKDSEYIKILYPLTAISCSITLILSLIFKKYRTWFYVGLWLLNSILWIFNTIAIF